MTQCFDYTFTGSEGAHIPITLPAQRFDTNYGVMFGPQTEPDTFTFSADTKTTTTFMMRTSGQVPAGRKVTITVVEKTA